MKWCLLFCFSIVRKAYRLPTSFPPFFGGSGGNRPKYLHTPSPVVACSSTRVGLLLPKSLSLSYESTLQPRQPCCMTNTRIQINIQHQAQTKSNCPTRYSIQPNSSLAQERRPCSRAAGARSSLYRVSLARDFRDDFEVAGQHPTPLQQLSAAVPSQAGLPDCNHFPSFKCMNIKIAAMNLLSVLKWLHKMS